MTEVRDVDIAVAVAEFEKAEAAVLKVQVEMERALVRAPMNSRVIKTHVQPGELIGPKGILQLGQTDTMWVRAEVYETDIGRVRIGQKAGVTSEVFNGRLEGTVEKIGLMIGRNRLGAAQAVADSDSRVVEVKIKLNESGSKTVAQFTNLQVTVIIHTGEE
jgi:HlyD family secretion protein